MFHNVYEPNDLRRYVCFRSTAHRSGKTKTRDTGTERSAWRITAVSFVQLWLTSRWADLKTKRQDYENRFWVIQRFTNVWTDLDFNGSRLVFMKIGYEDIFPQLHVCSWLVQVPIYLSTYLASFKICFFAYCTRIRSLQTSYYSQCGFHPIEHSYMSDHNDEKRFFTYFKRIRVLTYVMC